LVKHSSNKTKTENRSEAGDQPFSMLYCWM